MPSVDATFWHSWDGSAGSVALVRYSRSALERFGVALADRDFLADLGLPAWAAPHMHFETQTGDVLPLPEDPYGEPYPSSTAQFGMIGSASGWPLCFTKTRPGAVVWLHPGEAPNGILVNSSAIRLALCLRAYNEGVSEALKFGEQNGKPDAWRRSRYPDAIDDHLMAAMVNLDPEVAHSDGFWMRHFRARTGGA